MGCTNARQQTFLEEDLLVEQQQLLGFDVLDPCDIDFAVRKFTFNSYVNPSQLALLEEKLSITLHDSGEWPQVQAMMSHFESSIGWETKKLLILGLLCSNSNPHIKAKLIFEAYDEAFLGSLTQDQIKDLLKDMCMISTQVLGSLAPSEHRSSFLMSGYLKKCEMSIDRSVQNLMKHFKTVSTDSEFVRTLSALHDGLLLTPTGIRRYLRIEYTRNGPGKDFTNMRAVRSRGNSLAGRVRSVEYVNHDKLESSDTNSTNDEVERASSMHFSSVGSGLSRLD